MKNFKLVVLLIGFLIPLKAFGFADENSGPALWTMGDEDTTIHIFGTIHLMNEAVNWNTPKIKQAFEGADQLILELAPDQFDPALNQQLIVRYGLFLDGKKLPDVLSAERYQEVEGIIADMGLPMATINMMKPWLVATMITVEAAKGHGFLPENGVDKTLMDKALSVGKDVNGLETADFQISLFSDLKMTSQVTFLEATLDEVEIIVPLFEGMRDSWLAGDLEGLDQLLNQGWEPFPDLKEAILDDRNQNWAVELTELMDVPGTYFVAVGTGHLVGDGNLIELLEERGFEISRK